MSVASDFKSWDEVRDWLASGEGVMVHVWYFSEYGMNCGDDCCGDDFNSVDEALAAVQSYAHTIERVEK